MELRIRRGWVVVEGVAALMAAVLAGAELGRGEWVTGILLALLCASLGFQTAQAWGVLRIGPEGIEDNRVMGAGRVAWDRIERVSLGEGGLVTPPLRIEVTGRARPVVAPGPWTLGILVDGEIADWDRAGQVVAAHARDGGVEVRHGGDGRG